MRNNALVRQSLSRFGKDEPPKRPATAKVVRIEAGAKHVPPLTTSGKTDMKLRPGLY